jgi:hypothetical protein
VQEGTFLTQDEVTTLEEPGFFLSEKPKCHPINLFCDDASFLVNKPMNAYTWQKTQNGKFFCHALVFKISTQQQNKREAERVFLENILPPTNVPSLGYGRIYRIISCPTENCKQYEVTIGNFLAYTYIYFVLMMKCSFGARGKRVHCKHLYYILQHVMLCRLMEMFIHRLTWS